MLLHYLQYLLIYNQYQILLVLVLVTESDVGFVAVVEAVTAVVVPVAVTVAQQVVEQAVAMLPQLAVHLFQQMYRVDLLYRLFYYRLLIAVQGLFHLFYPILQPFY